LLMRGGPADGVARLVCGRIIIEAIDEIDYRGLPEEKIEARLKLKGRSPFIISEPR